jgi:hypothetical protein
MNAFRHLLGLTSETINALIFFRIPLTGDQLVKVHVPTQGSTTWTSAPIGAYSSARPKARGR